MCFREGRSYFAVRKQLFHWLLDYFFFLLRECLWFLISPSFSVCSTAGCLHAADQRAGHLPRWPGLPDTPAQRVPQMWTEEDLASESLNVSDLISFLFAAPNKVVQQLPFVVLSTSTLETWTREWVAISLILVTHVFIRHPDYNSTDLSDSLYQKETHIDFYGDKKNSYLLKCSQLNLFLFCLFPCWMQVMGEN